MSKRPDFALDLNVVKHDVKENVSDILAAANERAARRNMEQKALQQSVVEVPREEAAEPKKQRTHAVRKPSSRPQPSDAPVWKDVATKLTVETKECLRRAAALQRAEGLKPDTEYAITNEALEDWFKRHGYHRRWKSRENREDGPETTAEPTTDEP